MSHKPPIVRLASFGRRFLVLATLAAASLGMTPTVLGQEETADRTVRQRIKEYWDRLIAKAESSARSAGDEYRKLKDEAAKASGPAREKMAAEMDALSRKWARAREKLAHSTESRMNWLGEEVKALEEKAGKATGSAREKLAAEREKLHGEWQAARAKMEATLSANLNSSRDEIEHLKEHVADATDRAKAKLRPRMERLKSEFHKDREKLAEYLEADLKQTEEDVERLRGATSNAARHAMETLSKKAHDLKEKIEKLHKERLAEESE
jgi:polyhydroxyalkanoate synthesis regulator phasin